MGYPMARHLLKAGHDVALWTHSRSKAIELAREGKIDNTQSLASSDISPGS